MSAIDVERLARAIFEAALLDHGRRPMDLEGRWESVDEYARELWMRKAERIAFRYEALGAGT